MRLTLLFVSALFIRFWWFLQNSDPIGTDGYYYVVQVEDLLHLGKLHVEDSSWVFYLMAVFAWIFDDVIVGIKFGSSFLAALVVLGAYLLGKKFGSIQHAWILGIWAASSPTLTHLAGDFPKNLGVIAPIFLFLYFLLSSGSKAKIIAVFFGLLASICHKMGAGLFGIILIGYLISFFKREWFRQYLVFVIAIASFILLSLFIPSFLHPKDLSRLVGHFSYGLSPWSWLKLRPTHPVEIVELVIPYFSILAFLIKPNKQYFLLLLPLIVLLSPFWKPNELDLGYRMSLMAPFFGVPLLILTVRVSVRWYWVFATCLPFSIMGIDPKINPPYDKFRAIIDVIPRPLPDLLIAHQGINFLYDHVTGFEAMAWAPEKDLDRSKIGRIVYGVREDQWIAYTSMKTISLGHGYDYVSEVTWETLIKNGQNDEELMEVILDWHNPTRMRESILRK